jgi:hypothetical protein
MEFTNKELKFIRNASYDRAYGIIHRLEVCKSSIEFYKESIAMGFDASKHIKTSKKEIKELESEYPILYKINQKSIKLLGEK